jgi:hypothetical protein
MLNSVLALAYVSSCISRLLSLIGSRYIAELELDSGVRIYETTLCQVVLLSSHLFALAKTNAGSDDVTLLDTRSECTLTGSKC